MLSQSRPPVQLIIIDSSDEHQATVETVVESVEVHPVDLTILQSERGLTLQRNLSLPLIDHPVVFFPDDDSIWFPCVSRTILDDYEADLEKQIAAVCGVEWTAGFLMSFRTEVIRQVRFDEALFKDSLFEDIDALAGPKFVRNAQPPEQVVQMSCSVDFPTPGSPCASSGSSSGDC